MPLQQPGQPLGCRLGRAFPRVFSAVALHLPPPAACPCRNSWWGWPSSVRKPTRCWCLMRSSAVWAGQVRPGHDRCTRLQNTVLCCLHCQEQPALPGAHSNGWPCCVWRRQAVGIPVEWCRAGHDVPGQAPGRRAAHWGGAAQAVSGAWCSQCLCDPCVAAAQAHYCSAPLASGMWQM